MKTKLRHLSDDAVLKRLSSLVHDERAKTVEIIENLAECHRRGIILRRGHGSVLQYCLKVLHLSEHAAYHRIYAMHCALRYPIILEMLRDGSVNLTTIRLLGPHLRRDNHLELLNEARHKSKFDVMKLVARIKPQPAIPSTARKLPVRREERASPAPDSPPLLSIASADTGNRNGGDARPEEVAPTKRSVHRDPVTPLAPELYKFEFSAGEETHQKLEQVKELLRHQVPDGDIAVVFDMALSLLRDTLLEQKLGRAPGDRKKKEKSDSVRNESVPAPGASPAPTPTLVLAPNPALVLAPNPVLAPSLSATPSPSPAAKPNSRHIPTKVRQEVWKRDGGQCAFKADPGQRCLERGGLEFHHVTPYAWGGKATLQNIELRCRAHNAFEGEQIFGRRRREVLRE